MNHSFTVLTYSLLLLTILYIINYIFTLSSNCSGFLDTEEITEKQCCEGTWAKFESSVNLTLFLIGIGVIVIYVIFSYYF